MTRGQYRRERTRSGYTRHRAKLPASPAAVAQLVERNPPKVEVAGSIPVRRLSAPCPLVRLLASASRALAEEPLDRCDLVVERLLLVAPLVELEHRIGARDAELER